MNVQEYSALRLVRECLVFIVHGYAGHLCVEAINRCSTADGLCSMVSNWIEHRSHRAWVEYNADDTATWMVEWQESTKCRGYPVPAPHSAYTDPVFNDSRETFLAFHFYDSTGDKYDGEYGELRLDLARFLIGKIDEELAHYAST